jgi:histidyl-tRNA synthetase
MRFQAPRGTEDVLPADSPKWLHLEAAFREVTRLYGYQELRTPTFEDTNLFLRTAGETSDIVTKEMYSFQDKGDRPITLKPEGTAPAMRAVIEHSLCPPGTVLRLMYVTPIFRYGRPQKGRLREAHQVGLELVGSASAAADAEVIEITARFYQALGLTDIEVLLNSIGRDECRDRYREAILVHMESWLKDQSEETRDRTLKNPLRLLDTKDEATLAALQGLPPVTDFLEEDSRARFEQIQATLTDAGVAYRVSPEIVRGLDYYTETVFEVQSTKLGAQSSLCGGGRYDNLVKELGGSPTPSVGVAMGIERALIAMEGERIRVPMVRPDVFVVQATPEAHEVCQRVARHLRAGGVATMMDIDGRSMKSQLRQADKVSARWGVIIGRDELDAGAVQLRDLDNSDQTPVPLSEVVERVKERL